MTKPKELDLNLPALRGEAMQQLLTGLRLAVQRFDDLDAVERVLNAHANTAHAAPLKALRNQARLASAGIGAAQPAFKKKHDWSNQSKHQELTAGIIKALKGALAPMQSGAIIKIMRTLGVKNFAQATFSRNLKALVDKGVIERVKEARANHFSYRLNPAAAEYQAIPVVRRGPSKQGNKTSVLVTEVLAAHPAGASKQEIVTGVIAKGFKATGTSSPGDCIYAYLTAQIARGTIKATGPVGRKTYRLQRPHFSVSREASA